MRLTKKIHSYIYVKICGNIRRSMENSVRQRLYQGKTAYLTRIFARWRSLNINTLILCLITVSLVWIEFILFDNKFYPHCALYAKLSFGRVAEPNTSLSYAVILEGDINHVTKWGPEAVCNFIMSVIIINVIVAFAGLITFAVEKKYSPNFQRKLTPCFCICSIVANIITFTGAIAITRGGSIFCESFRGTELNCPTAQHVNWINFPTMHKFYDYLMGCQITIWITTGVWYFTSLIVLFRWSTDADNVIADEKESDDRDMYSNMSRFRSRNQNEDFTHRETENEDR